MRVREHDKLDDDSNEDLFDKKELRKRKDKKRQHKQREKEECTRESFKKMKDEIDELRRKETERAKELEQLKKKIDKRNEEMTDKETEKEIEYALGFNKDTYLSKGFIESAQWIRNTLAKSMIEKMLDEQNRERFEVLVTSKKASAYLGVRACARFNRGEECSSGKWHTTQKIEAIWTKNGTNHPERLANRNVEQAQKRNELRLHICTLCLDALGSANGHSVLNCPWILIKNWKD